MMYPGKDSNMIAREDLGSCPLATVEDLRAKISDPVRSKNAGKKWMPIPHLDLVSEITCAIEKRGLRIADERFQLSDDQHDIFGFIRFDPKTAPQMPEIPGSGRITPTLGFRHSNMQRFRLLGVHGEEVFVCSNGVISGDFLFGFKSTIGNVGKLDVGIEAGMETWEAQAADARRLIEFLAEQRINTSRADQLLMEGMRRGVYAANQLGKIDETYRAYLDDSHPHHEAFAERNLWSLYNAVTEVGKKWSVRNVEKGLKGFPRVLADAYGFEMTRLVEDAPEGDSSLTFNPSLN